MIPKGSRGYIFRIARGITLKEVAMDSVVEGVLVRYFFYGPGQSLVSHETNAKCPAGWERGSNWPLMDILP
jgi:hypothetical protein